MTSKERMLAALNFRKPDRVPVFLNNALATSHVIGLKVSQVLHDPERFAQALVASFEEYGYDGVRISCDVTLEAESMGAVVKFPEDAGGSVIEHPVRDRESFERLPFPDPAVSGRMPLMLETVRRVRAILGDGVFIASTIGGPMNMTSQLLGVDQALVMLLEEPELIEDMLDFCTRVAIMYGTEMKKAGADCVNIGEASCSVNLLGPNHYRRIVKERHTRLIRALREAGVEYQTMHICGRLAPILKDVADTGVASADIDSPVDLRESRAVLGRRLCMIGNISPTELLMGSPERVDDLAREAIGCKDGLGFILGAGCNMAVTTPPENIRTMVAAAKKYGMYED